MDIILHPFTIWFLIGMLFFVVEIILPQFVLFFFGVSAWIIASLGLFFNIGLENQIGLFFSSSVLMVIFFRRFVKSKFMKTKKDTTKDKNKLQHDYGIVTKFIQKDKIGRVECDGTTWEAISDDNIHVGERVKIMNQKGLTLKVKPLSHNT